MNEIYLFKKRCVQCSRINEDGKEAYECDTDPSCPAGTLNLKVGVNPNIIKSKVCDLVKTSFNDDDIHTFNTLIETLNQLDKNYIEPAFIGFCDGIVDIVETKQEVQQDDDLESDFLDDEDDTNNVNEVEETP